MSMTSSASFLTMGMVLYEVSGKPEREVSQNEIHDRLQTGWCGHFQEGELTLAVSLPQVLPVQAALFYSHWPSHAPDIWKLAPLQTDSQVCHSLC